MLKLSSSQAEQLKNIGAQLQKKRLEKTLSLEDIAAITMIRPPILRALEEGIVEQLPELVYVKGLIRRYAETLKIDGQTLANTLSTVSEPEVVETPEEAQVQPPKPTAIVTPTKPIPATNPQTSTSGSKYLPYLLLVLGGLLLAGLGSIFWRSPEPKITTPKTAPTMAPSVVQASPTVAPSAQLPPPVQSEATPSPSPVAPTTPLSVTVKLEDRSWLEIFVDGELGYRGTLAAGEQKTWTAKKAFNIKAGNAGAVKLSVNQKPPQPLGKLGEVKELTLTANSN